MLLRSFICTFATLSSSLLWAAEKEDAVVGVARATISKGTLMETVGGLIFVIFLIIALGWGFKKFARMPLSGKGSISILGGVSLGPRERAVLIQVGETQLLVGVAPGRVQTLHVLTDPVPMDSPSKPQSGFSGKLKQVMKQQGEAS